MKRRSLVLLTLSLSVVLSCAKQQPPPGGPEDKTPPEVTATVPETGAVNVDRLPDVTISFSERMQHEKTREALFVSPPPPGELRTDWKKNNLRIEFTDSLEADRTYLVTVGSSATDMHSNRLTSSISIAFSTGGSLDSGSVSGIVRSKGLPYGGATVAAFPFSTVDSIDLSKSRPEYITQSGSDGSYNLNYVSPGDYVLFAYDDRNRNNLWDPPKEQIGFPTRPALISGGIASVSNLDFAMAARDTMPLGVSNARISGDRVLFVELTQAALKSDIEGSTVRLVSADTPDTLSVDSIFAWQDSTKAFVGIVSDTTFPEALYLRIYDLEDTWGNEIETSEDSLLLQPPIGRDRTPPTLETSEPSSGSRNVSTTPSIAFRFNEPVDFGPDSSALILVDPDSTETRCTFERRDPFTLSFSPVDSLKQATRYDVIFQLASVRDRAGNVPADSDFTFDFETIRRDSLGSFSGNVTLKYSTGGQTPVLFYSALPNGSWILLELNDAGKFVEEVLPGNYRFGGFYDRNGDGYYSSGQLAPFEYSEPIITINDTVSVRSRFETEDVVLQER